MAVTIPLRSDLPQFDFQVELDGATYSLEFFWNFRESAWYMTINDGDGLPVIAGVKVVVGFPLGRRIQNARMPPGSLWAEDTSGKSTDPGLNDLGQRVQIYYFSKGEQP